MNPEPFLISIFQLPGQVDNAGVLDIGAGNANCAMLAAGLMKLTVPDAVIGAGMRINVHGIYRGKGVISPVFDGFKMF